MGMQTYPCSGYVMKVKDLLAALPEEARKAAEGFIKQADEVGLQDILQNFLPAEVPVPFQVFHLGSADDCNDNMERGEFYALFDDDDLYEKVERPAVAALRKAASGKGPQHSSWTVYG